MGKIVLVDFGASRIKFVLYDTYGNTIIDTIDVESPSTKNHSTVPGHFEIPAQLYWDAFNTTLLKLVDQHEIDSAYICSEMHGFVLLDQTRPDLSVYYSWKDQRVEQASLNYYSDTFKQTTGMQLRKGFPFATLTALDLDKSKSYLFCTLVDYIMHSGRSIKPESNITLSASTGLVDIHTKEWSSLLLDLLELHPGQLRFNKLSTNTHEYIGNILFNNSVVPIYGGIGDFQSAMLGAGLGKEFAAVVNLGTGSQVACITRDLYEHEIRPLDEHRYAKVFTHIPSGRALNVVAEFVDSIGGKGRFWALWKDLTAEQVIAAPGTVDLNVFEAAWQYSDTSGFIPLRENQSDIKQVIANIANSWAQQYVLALNKLDPTIACKEVAVVGGLAHKSLFITSVFNSLDSTRSYKTVKSITGEETLDGLLKIYLEK
jgi:sugar (pentulose or hexulose) kinase